jgi:hypothetical protein
MARLGVGEVVALDPEIANGVRRARPRDMASTVGVVSRFGTRNNDDHVGARDADDGYVNVGLVGQLPALISLENGAIAPGDPLTLSTRWRGRVAKAVGPARIVGFATTHFPYVEGEKDYLDDALGGPSHRLTADHVMMYLNVGWYEPSWDLDEGEEPSPQESAFALQRRMLAVRTPEQLEEERRDRERLATLAAPRAAVPRAPNTLAPAVKDVPSGAPALRVSLPR